MATTTDNAVRRRRRPASNRDAPNNQGPAQGANTAAGTAQAGTAAERGGGDNAAAAQLPRNALREFLFRTLLMYAMYHFYIKPKSAPKLDPAIPAANVKPAPPAAGSQFLSLLGVDVGGPTPPHYNYELKCKWSPNTPFGMRVYTSLQPKLSFAEAASVPPSREVWVHSDLSLSTAVGNYRGANVTVDVPREVAAANSSWYAHVFVVKEPIWDSDPAQLREEVIEENVLYSRYEIITWLDASKNKEKKSLLDSTNETETSTPAKPNASADTKPEEGSSEDDAAPQYKQMWRPYIPVVLVTTTSSLFLGQLPPTASSLFKVSVAEKAFFPAMHVDDFWTLESSLQAMNASVESVRLELSFTPMSLYKWSLYRQFENVWKRQTDFGAIGKGEVDELKRMFIETNPILLITTMIVSLVHTILEALAFKNDISHWKNIKTMEGVSVRSMMWKIAMEAIIFLYLFDNDTSWMITIGNGVGVGIEIWKLTKAVKFENFGKRRLLGFIPWFEVSDRESYSKETKEYDEQAMKYLSYAVYPLVLGYALYSLHYEKHRSWYSWVISSLVGAVYAFGFIMMFPQIFINYKLKSVAHIPLKAMMYKTLNTVIDDLFSFIIKMPWLHRLACFRDDVVFLVILYQRWIYPVDKTRVNEFGQRFDENGNEIIEESRAEGVGERGAGDVASTHSAGDGSAVTNVQSNEDANEIPPEESEVVSGAGASNDGQATAEKEGDGELQLQEDSGEAVDELKSEVEKKND